MLDVPRAWSMVQQFMLTASGVVLAEDQAYLMEARLAPVAQKYNFGSIPDLVAASCSQAASTPMAQDVIDAMTTHESYFFRDTAFWTALRQVVMPDILTSRRGPPRFWSAGSAHGQEAYSLAMLLEEEWPEVAESATILATDISQVATERAQRGIYSALEVNRGLNAKRIARHFEGAPGGFRLREKLRNRVTWRVQNLLDPDSYSGPFDLIMCRNTLIYFSDKDKQAVLKRLCRATRAAGYVGMGATENPWRGNNLNGWYRMPLEGK